jgi:hypothetical protein
MLPESTANVDSLISSRECSGFLAGVLPSPRLHIPLRLFDAGWVRDKRVVSMSAGDVHVYSVEELAPHSV